MMDIRSSTNCSNDRSLLVIRQYAVFSYFNLIAISIVLYLPGQFVKISSEVQPLKRNKHTNEYTNKLTFAFIIKVRIKFNNFDIVLCS